MSYQILATDYDGTIATKGRLDAEALAALERLRSAGHRALLVTGREIDDLRTVCPDLSPFDLIVAENGALLHWPEDGREKLLAKAPPPNFVDALREKGISPLSVGRVIVATFEPHESEVLATIKALGLELQVIFNKGAVMILPAGVTKATGLTAALEVYGLPASAVVGVGDAENDHAFLEMCGYSAAVANALPSLKRKVKWVAERSHGAGVADLIDRWLAGGLVEAGAPVAVGS